MMNEKGHDFHHGGTEGTENHGDYFKKERLCSINRLIV